MVGMDYNTLLHEYGHLQQVRKAKGEGIELATYRGFYTSNGFSEVGKANKNFSIVLEYHNRLKDKKRYEDLASNGVQVPEVLMDQVKTGASYHKEISIFKSGRNERTFTKQKDKIRKRIGSIIDEIESLEN